MSDKVLVDRRLLEFAMHYIEEQVALYHYRVKPPIDSMCGLLEWIEEKDKALEAVPDLIASGRMPTGYYELQALVSDSQ